MKPKFTIHVGGTDYEAEVIIEPLDGDSFEDFMLATEFMMHKMCQRSKAGYERALELLCKGAMTWKELEEDQGNG